MSNPVSATRPTPPLGPAAGTALASGKVFNNTFAARPDGNWFGTFGLNYIHDFEQQNGNTFESSMSIAPNTDIAIDEHVYDPNANNGHMLVSLTQGALRFVGGQLSHQGEATITTSAANIGIRGGTVTVIQGQNGTKVINHFGIIKIVNGAGTFLITRPDFGALIQSWNTLIQDLGRIPTTEVAFHQAHTTSTPGQDGGVSGFTGANIGHCGIGSVPGTNCPQVPWMPTDGGQLDASQILGNATNFGPSQNNPPPPPPPKIIRGR
jgi:hypothetical protein